MTKPSLTDEPSLSVENNDNANEKTGIWASILRDVKSSTKKAPATKSLIVLGDNESGRTTLVAKLQGNEDPKRGAGLEYHYIDVKDDDRDDTPKLGVWILDGDVACSAPLLKFALKAETVENTILLLVASMTQPWSLLSTLKKWTLLIEEHLDRLKLDPIRLREMRDRFQYEFQHYIEPNESSTMIASSSSSSTIKNSTNRIPNSTSSISIASSTATTTMSPTNVEESVVLPLPDGVLTKSLGIPIIVVITKCDAMSSLEKENDYKDEHFDFMQHHLRKFCLEYGAALFYTSVKEKKNIDKLYKYIVHKCYGYPFTSTAAIVDRDAIFIPSGWDNPKKADILLENLHRLKSNSNYSDVFVKPVLRRPLQRDNEIITAEDDQEFLSKLQLTLNRASSPSKTEENGTHVSRTSNVGPPAGSQTPIMGTRPRAQPSGAGTGAAGATNEGALANFFNSLLTRKSGGAVTPTSSATTTNAQRQITQSPTTPSSKRLQQHPLTFAVTPPARTRTPTSQRTFSPQSITDAPIAVSPSKAHENFHETPIETKSEPNVLNSSPSNSKQIFDNVTDVPQETSNDDSQALKTIPGNIDHNTDNEKQSVTETTTADRDLPSSTDVQLHDPVTTTSIEEENASFTETPDHKENVDHNATETNDKMAHQQQIHPSSSFHDTTTAPEETKRSRSPSPSRYNDDDNTAKRSRTPSPITRMVEENQPSRSRSSSPNSQQKPDETKTRSRSPSPIPDQTTETTPRRNQSPTTEQAKQRSRSPSPGVHQFDGQDNVVSSTPENHERKSHSPSPLKEQTPNRSRSPSPAARPVSPTTEQAKVRSRSPSPVEGQTTEQTPHRSRSPSPTTQANPADVDPTKVRSRSPSPMREETIRRSRSPSPTARPVSPTTEQAQVRSRSPSPVEGQTTEQTPHRSRSPSPSTQAISSTTEQTTVRSRSPSPMKEDSIVPIPHRSRSPSPTTEASLTDVDPTKVRSRSPSPVEGQTTEQTPHRSRSPSPTTQASPADVDPTKVRSRSPSPMREETIRRSRSPSPTVQAVSSTTEEGKARSRSSSPMKPEKAEQTPHRSRTPSPKTQASPADVDQTKVRSRSPSPMMEETIRRSRSPSPTAQAGSPTSEQTRVRSRSPSPTTEASFTDVDPIKVRSRSPSPMKGETISRSRSPSPTARPVSPSTEQAKVRSRSPSPMREQTPHRSRSPSPTALAGATTTQQAKARSRSPSPVVNEFVNEDNVVSSMVEKHDERSRSPSPINAAAMEERTNRSRSPSPTTEANSADFNQKKVRGRSPSPMREGTTRRSRSPSPSARPVSPTTEQTKVRSRSASPVNEETTEETPHRSRSPSATTETSSTDFDQTKVRSRSPSPLREEAIRRSRSPSPTARPVSPTNEQIPERSRSPSPIREQTPQRSRSPSPTALAAPSATQQAKARSRSPSPSVNESTNEDNVVSSIVEKHQERSRSPSPINATVNENQVRRSRSPSPIIEQVDGEDAQDSPPNSGQNRERSRSPSPNRPEVADVNESSISSGTEQTIEELKIRSRSPSPSRDRNENEDHLTSSTVVGEHQQRSRSPSPVIQRDETENDRSASPITEETKPRSRSPSLNGVQVDEELIKHSRSSSPIAEIRDFVDERPSSPSAEQAKIRSRSPSPSGKTMNQLIDLDNGQLTAEDSPTPSIALSENQDNVQSSAVVSQLDNEGDVAPLPFVAQNTQRSRSPSPRAERIDEKPKEDGRSTSPRPTGDENQDEVVSSPIDESSHEQNHFQSPNLQQTAGNSEIRRSHSPSPSSPSPKLLNEQNEIPSLSETNDDIEREFTFEETNNSSPPLTHGEPIPIPSLNRRESIPRSHSQTSMTRPTTLRFSPNNHDLDGLYVTNLSDEETEHGEDNEHHPNSAPSTVSSEYRSFHHQQSEQRYSPVNPIEISKRLSIVEKSRPEDAAEATTGVDTSHSKDN